MKHTFLWLSLGLSSGIFFQKFFPVPLLWIGAVFFCLLPSLWLSRGSRSFIFLLIIMSGLLGMGIWENGKIKGRQEIENFATGELLTLEGIVKTLPEVKQHQSRSQVSFVIDVKNVKKRNERLIRRAEGNVQVFAFHTSEIPEFASTVRLRGRLTRPEPAMNPGGFEYGSYLEQRGICCVMRTYGAWGVRTIRKPSFLSYQVAIAKLRNLISRRINQLFRPEFRGIYQGILLGMRKNISADIRDDFMKTGTAHLLAISGLHVALVTGSFYFFLVILGFPQKWAALIGLAGVILFTEVAGAGVPVLRAGGMASLFLMSLLFERAHFFWSGLFAAYFFLLTAAPQNLFNVSFQLSFVSVLALILLFPRKFREWEWRWSETFFRSAAVLLGTFPIGLYYFYTFSPISLVANVVAIPLFHAALLSGLGAILFGGFPWIGNFWVIAADGCLWLVLEVIRRLAALKWGYFYHSPPAMTEMAAYYVLLGGAIVCSKFRFRFSKWFRGFFWTGWAACCFLMLSQGIPAQFQAVFFNAGKNEISYIRFPKSEHWLFNAGRSRPSDQVRWIVLPAVKKFGVNQLSAVLFSDTGSRHVSGAESLAKNLAIERWIFPIGGKIEQEKFFSGYNVPVEFCFPGKIIFEREEGDIRCLDTFEGKAIYQIRYRRWNFIILPSTEPVVFERLRRHSEALKSLDVLVLPAVYRSRLTRTYAELERFLDSADPAVVIMPQTDPAIADMLAFRDILFFDTETHGAITFSEDTRSSLRSDALPRGPDFEFLTVAGYRSGPVAFLR